MVINLYAKLHLSAPAEMQDRTTQGSHVLPSPLLMCMSSMLYAGRRLQTVYELQTKTISKLVETSASFVLSQELIPWLPVNVYCITEISVIFSGLEWKLPDDSLDGR